MSKHDSFEGRPMVGDWTVDDAIVNEQADKAYAGWERDDSLSDEVVERLLRDEARSIRDINMQPELEIDYVTMRERPNQELKQQALDVVSKLCEVYDSRISMGDHLRNMMINKDELQAAWPLFAPGGLMSRQKNKEDHGKLDNGDVLVCKGLDCYIDGCTRGQRLRFLKRNSAESLKVKKPALTKKHEALLAEDTAEIDREDLDTYRTKGAGSWVIYSHHEDLHFQLNKARPPMSDKAAADMRNDMLNAAADKLKKANLDMVLPDYPWADEDDVDHIAEYKYACRDWTKFSGKSNLCDWVKSHKSDYLDTVDNMRTAMRRAPSSSVRPHISIDELKVHEYDAHGNRTVIDTWKYEGKFFARGNSGKAYRYRTGKAEWRAKELLRRCLAGSIHPRFSMDCISFRGVRTVSRPLKVHKQAVMEIRTARCGYCSKQIKAKHDAYYNMVNAVEAHLDPDERKSWACEHGPDHKWRPGQCSAYTMFIKDNFDRRYTQRAILGDDMFEARDTWELRGNSGNWGCAMCGRSKDFKIADAWIRIRVKKIFDKVTKVKVKGRRTRRLERQCKYHMVWMKVRIGGLDTVEAIEALLK